MGTFTRHSTTEKRWFVDGLANCDNFARDPSIVLFGLLPGRDCHTSHELKE